MGNYFCVWPFSMTLILLANCQGRFLYDLIDGFLVRLIEIKRGPHSGAVSHVLIILEIG